MRYEALHRRRRRLASGRPRSGVALLHALVALLGCGGEQMVVGEEVAQAGDASGTGPGAAPGGVRLPGISVVAECPPSPEERNLRLGCWPTRHVGRWRGFVLGDPMYETLQGSSMPFPVTDIMLTVGPLGASRLSFGEPVIFSPPVGSGDPYLCAGSSPAVGCPAAESIIVGYDYPLENLEILDASVAVTARASDEPAPRVGERLSFDVPLDQPWRLWCELQEPEPGSCDIAEQDGAASLRCHHLGTAPDSLDNDACQVIEGDVTRNVDCGWLAARETAPCSCSDEGCFALRASLSISLQLSSDGRALRGSVHTPLGRELGHLEFLREFR